MRGNESARGDESTRGGESMSDEAGAAGRNAPKKRVLRSVAAQAAVLSAAVHFLWAWPRLGELGDPRPAVFLLGGAFTVAIAVATLRADEYRRLYALGAGTLLAFLVGYVGWHGAGVAAALAADPLAIVAAVAEAVGTVAFLALYRLAPPTSVVVERRRGPEAGGTENGDAESGGTES
ncbi:hypothetical protein C461_13118 [Halorubrum aidingense JCM 13560]|uniref:Uncharacterized protein n=1 Tax=Halorubrum aidingense JCM 13560 TaxID=1230454 RepID=M0P985_9EURY|nr:hypothetical protein C461_13118 [Halorubrum aidingense JCM 13560]